MREIIRRFFKSIISFFVQIKNREQALPEEDFESDMLSDEEIFQEIIKIPSGLDIKVKAPQFMKFLKNIFDNDSIEVLQKWAGMVLLGYNFAQRILIIHGPGASGKSTLQNIITGIIGKENVGQLRTEHLGTAFETSAFIGKNLLCAPDEKYDFLASRDAGKLKRLVGGDIQIAERKHSNKRSVIKGKFNVFITMNTKPLLKVEDDYEAWARRLIILKTKPKKTIKPRIDFTERLLSKEKGEILKWILLGSIKLRTDFNRTGNMVIPKSVYENTENALNEATGVEIFAEKSLAATGSNDGITMNELQEVYLGFCNKNGWRPADERDFKKRLTRFVAEKFYKSTASVKNNGVKEKGFKGLKIRK
ncbi:MAG: hypothetical protein A2017_09265 [Lentisphaerae bacterium GWF2_44_16]|nr:MAG: hypothetical protein A2017_09265 [Lentisphaerae bacterium GWF2_44_16]